MPFRLTRPPIRLTFALLTAAADVGVQLLNGYPRIYPATELLFVVLGLLAGVVIARWWAMTIGFTWLGIAMMIPPDPEGGRAFVALVAAEIGFAQALLIAIGVVVAKLLARRWPGHRRGARA